MSWPSRPARRTWSPMSRGAGPSPRPATRLRPPAPAPEGAWPGGIRGYVGCPGPGSICPIPSGRGCGGRCWRTPRTGQGAWRRPARDRWGPHHIAPTGPRRHCVPCPPRPPCAAAARLPGVPRRPTGGAARGGRLARAAAPLDRAAGLLPCVPRRLFGHHALGRRHLAPAARRAAERRRRAARPPRSSGRWLGLGGAPRRRISGTVARAPAASSRRPGPGRAVGAARQGGATDRRRARRRPGDVRQTIAQQVAADRQPG